MYVLYSSIRSLLNVDFHVLNLLLWYISMCKEPF